MRLIPNRERLPNRRASESFDFELNGLRFTATIARFADGRLAEVFLASNKSGSQVDATARDAAVLASLALQYGVPVETLRLVLMRDEDGKANGPLGAALDIMAACGELEADGL